MKVIPQTTAMPMPVGCLGSRFIWPNGRIALRNCGLYEVVINDIKNILQSGEKYRKNSQSLLDGRNMKASKLLQIHKNI